MSRQSNIGSPIPSPIDIDTPEGSILGVDMMDNETQYTYQWEEKELLTIEAHKEYINYVWEFLHDLEKDGPKGKVLPKKTEGRFEIPP